MLVTSWTATTTATATKKMREEKKNHYFSCPFNFACCCCCCWSSHMHVASVWSFVQTPYIHSVCAQFTMLIFFFFFGQCICHRHTDAPHSWFVLSEREKKRTKIFSNVLAQKGSEYKTFIAFVQCMYTHTQAHTNAHIRYLPLVRWIYMQLRTYIRKICGSSSSSLSLPLPHPMQRNAYAQHNRK